MSSELAPQDPASSVPAAFDVVVASTGQVVSVGSGQSTLDALESAGYVVPWLCRAGFCGTCITEVVDGTPDHRDTAVNHDTDPNLMAVCVSRSKTTRLTLNL
ncbi:2Fe-2S iron-sulfur cluster-binding protein [Rhodococcus triatomae]